MKISKRTAILGASLLLTLLALGYYRRDLGTAYVSSQFRDAVDADAELEAAKRFKTWIHWTRGYRVTAYDTSGSRFSPHVTKNYDAVDKLEINWEKGTHVERKILNRESLRYIYGE